VATDNGGTNDSQPWDRAQPPYQARPPYGQPPSYGQPPPYWERHYAGQSPHSGPPYGQPPDSGQPYGEPPRREPAPDPGVARRRRIRVISVAGLVLGLIGLIVFGIKAGVQMAPRKFTAAQQQQITDWEFGQRWRDLPAGTIFPASVRYPPPAALDDPSLTLSAQRAGVAKQASCVSAADPAVAAVLVRDGCSAILRATYVDETDSYVVTVGAAVLPGVDEAETAKNTIAGVVGLGSAVQAVPFKGTPAADFTDEQGQLSGVLTAGTYVVLYTVGYTGSRPMEQVTADGYAEQEMTSAGAGVAHDVLSVLAAPVPAPHCPGAPGC
jgi:hypothetical protein